MSPRSIAVIGASRTEGSVGHAVLRNLVFGGFTGVLYPVNPRAHSILGIRSHAHIRDVGEQVDLAVIVVPAAGVTAAVRECADAGVRHFVIISAGFREIGGEGVQREDELRALAEARGLHVVGPNCVGHVNTDPAVRMNSTFVRGMPQRGALGLISQSGAVCAALLDYAAGSGVGFSRFVSYGNRVAVREADLLRNFAADPLTRVILMYIEDLSDGPSFVQAAFEITRGLARTAGDEPIPPKPILVVKTGRTPQGAAAAASHTGALAGSDRIYEAVLAQAGVIRVESAEDLFDCAQVLIDPQRSTGRRTAIVTNAGGPGIMATDACIRSGLELTTFADETLRALRQRLPATASVRNPVDLVGDADSTRYRAALEAVMVDPGVDQICVVYAPTALAPVESVAQVVLDARSSCTKPMVAVLMGSQDVRAGVKLLRGREVPTYAFPEDAMRALAAKVRYNEWVGRPLGRARRFDVDREGVARLLDEALRAGRPQLVELHALEVLRRYGLPIAPFRLVRTADEAAAAARELGMPVALKIAGPTILHKTDVGGVRLNLADEAAVRRAFDAVLDSARRHVGARVELWGALVQRMLPKGREVILGCSRDARFGHVLMFGLGGVLAEALGDVTFRLAPLRDDVALEMIRDVRAYRLLQPFRGEPAADVDKIAECLLRLSQLVGDHPCIRELDVNPLIAFAEGDGAMVADARIILDEA